MEVMCSSTRSDLKFACSHLLMVIVRAGLSSQIVFSASRASTCRGILKLEVIMVG